jgi:hypothetical protein
MSSADCRTKGYARQSTRSELRVTSRARVTYLGVALLEVVREV